VKKGRAVRASDAAFTLIDAVPAAIADPGTTAVWEQALDMIEAGQMTLDTFIEKQSAWVGQLVQQYRGATLSLKLPPAPACPQCGAPMRQRTGKSGAFWSCSRYPDCKGTLPIESSTASRRSAPRKRRAAPRRPDPRFPRRAGHFLAARQTSRTPRDSPARVSFCNGVRAPSARHRATGREGHCSTNRARRGSLDRCALPR
jgi:hypothetical protein